MAWRHCTKCGRGFVSAYGQKVCLACFLTYRLAPAVAREPERAPPAPHMEPTRVEAVSPRRAEAAPHGSRQAAAAEFLTTILASGPVRTVEVQRLAAEAGLAWAALSRASVLVGARCFRIGGFANKGYWVWALHHPNAKESSDALSQVPLLRTQ